MQFKECKFALKLFQLLTISNLFPLEVVPKWQRCQLCARYEIISFVKRNTGLEDLQFNGYSS